MTKARENRKKPQKTTLTTPQIDAITAIMSSTTIKGAAVRANVPLRTLESWLADNELFKAELKRQQSAALDQGTRILVSLNQVALARLGQILGSPTASEGAILKAIDLTLNHTIRRVEVTELVEQLAAMEAADNEAKNNRW